MRTVPADQNVDAGGDVALHALVGIGQATIRDALGPPDSGREHGWYWIYWFYHLAEGPDFITIGGGSQLELEFAHDICTRARWAYTQ